MVRLVEQTTGGLYSGYRNQLVDHTGAQQRRAKTKTNQKKF
jgi:hypothetical protein